MKCCSPFERGKVKDELRLECLIGKINFYTHVLKNSGEPPKKLQTTQLLGRKMLRKMHEVELCVTSWKVKVRLKKKKERRKKNVDLR